MNTYNIPHLAVYSPCYYSLRLFGSGIPYQHSSMPRNKKMTIGCRTHVSTACATRPTINGQTAPPMLPKALMVPMPLSISLGAMPCKKADMAHGYTGPRSTPTMATATALPMTLGTSQTSSSKTRAPTTSP